MESFKNGENNIEFLKGALSVNNMNQLVNLCACSRSKNAESLLYINYCRIPTKHLAQQTVTW